MKNNNRFKANNTGVGENKERIDIGFDDEKGQVEFSAGGELTDFIQSFTSNRDTRLATEFVKRCGVYSEVTFDNDSFESMLKNFSIKDIETKGQKHLHELKFSLGNVVRTYNLISSGDESGVRNYRLAGDDLGELRNQGHDIVLKLIVGCSVEYRSISHYYKNGNFKTDPVNNDGEMNGRVVEVTTFMRKFREGVISGRNIIASELREKLTSYSRHITNPQTTMATLVNKIDFWIIDLTEGSELILNLLQSSKGGRVPYVLGSLLNNVASIASKVTPVKRPKWTFADPVHTDSDLIKDFLGHFEESSTSKEFYNEVTKWGFNMNRRMKEYSDRDIARIIRKETAEANRYAVEDFASTFVPLYEACSKIPTGEGGVLMSDLISFKRRGDLPKVGLITTVGSREWNCDIPSIEFAKILMENSSDIMFPSNKNKKFLSKDTDFIKAVEKVVFAYGSISDDTAKKLNEIGTNYVNIRHKATPKEKKKLLEDLGWSSEKDADSLFMAEVEKIKVKPGTKIVLGGMLKMNDKRDVRSLGVKENESKVVDDRAQLYIPPSSQATFDQKMSKIINDKSNTDIKEALGKIRMDTMKEMELPEEVLTTAELSKCLSNIKTFNSKDKARVIGELNGLNPNKIIGPPGKVTLMKEGLIKAYSDFSEIMMEKPSRYLYDKFEVAVQLQMKLNPTLTKALDETVFVASLDSAKECIYISSNGKSPRVSGSITKVSFCKRDFSMSAQEQIDSIDSRISVFDIQNRGYKVSKDYIILYSQSFRFDNSTFLHTEEYLGSYIALKSTMKSMNLKTSDPWLDSIYLDHKRSLTDMLDIVYFFYKQVGGSGSNSKNDIDEFMSDHQMSDPRVSLAYARMRNGFGYFSEQVRSELSSGRGFKWSTPLKCPLTRCMFDSVMHTGLIAYQKNGGWKNDGADAVKVIFDFLVKELGFEADEKKLKFNSIPVALKDETIKDYYMRIRAKPSEGRKEAKLRHNMRITYLTSYLAAKRISVGKLKSKLVYSMQDVDPQQGTSSMVAVPVPTHIIINSIESMKAGLQKTRKKWNTLKEESGFKPDGKYEVLIKRIANNLQLFSLLNNPDEGEEEAMAYVKILETSDHIITRLIHDEVRERKRMLEMGDNYDEKKKKDITTFTLPKATDNYTNLNIKKGVMFSRRPFDEDNTKEYEDDDSLNEEIKQSEEENKLYSSTLLSAVNDEFEKNISDNEDADAMVEEDEDLKGIFKCFIGLFEDKVKAMMNSKNKRTAQIIQFQKVLWDILPTPTNPNLTLHSVIQQHALLANEIAFMKVFGRKKTPSLLELSCFLDEVEHYQTTVKACLKDQYGYGKRIFFLQTFNAWCRNKVTEEFIRNFLNHTDEDVLHLPGNSKNIKIEEVLERYGINGDIFYRTGDKTRYGDTLSLYVLSAAVAGMVGAGIVDPDQFKYIVYTHNCLRYRRLLIPNEYVVYLKNSLKPLMKAADFKSESFKGGVDSDITFVYSIKMSELKHKLNVIKEPGKITEKDMKTFYNCNEIINLLRGCSIGQISEFGTTHHTLGQFYLLRTIGFILGVLNWLASWCSMLICVHIALCMNWWFVGVDYNELSHSDDSVSMQNSLSLRPEHTVGEHLRQTLEVCDMINKGQRFKMMNSEDVNVFDKFQVISEATNEMDDDYDEEEEIAKEEEKSKMYPSSIASLIAAAMNAMVAGIYGQRDSAKKTSYGSSAEFLQKTIYRHKCIDPVFSMTAGIMRPLAGECPTYDLLGMVSRVYNLICNNLAPDLINVLMFVGNWWIKCKYRQKKVYHWNSYFAFEGGYWAMIQDIFTCQFSACLVYKLAYIKYGADKNLVNKLRKDLVLSSTLHNIWKNFQSGIEPSETWSINIEDDENHEFTGQEGCVKFAVNLAAGRKVNERVATTFRGLIKHTDGLSEKGGVPSEVIASYVADNAYISVLPKQEFPVLKLARQNLSLMRNNVSKMAGKLPMGQNYRRFYGYMNITHKFKNKDGDVYKLMKLGDIFKHIRDLCDAGSISDWVLEDNENVSKFVEMNMSAYGDMLESCWNSDYNNFEFTEVDLYKEEMTKWRYRIYDVTPRQGIPLRLANCIASYLLEFAKIRDEMIKNGDESKLVFPFEESFAARYNPSLVGSADFANIMKTVLALFDIQNKSSRDLSPMISSWVNRVSSSTHSITVMMPNITPFEFLYSYTVADNKILKGGLRNISGSLQQIFAGKPKDAVDNEVEQRTYNILNAIVCNSQYAVKLSESLNAFRIDVSYVEIIERMRASITASEMDLMLACLMFKMTFDEGGVSKFVRFFRYISRESDKYMVVLNKFYLYYEIEIGEDDSRVYYQMNSTSVNCFRFLNAMISRYLLRRGSYPRPTLSNAKCVSSKMNLPNVTAEGNSVFVVGLDSGSKIRLPLRVDEEGSDKNFAKLLSEFQKENKSLFELTFNQDTLSFHDLTFHVCPWKFVSDGVTSIVSNVDFTTVWGSCEVTLTHDKLTAVCSLLYQEKYSLFEGLTDSQLIDFITFHQLVRDTMNKGQLEVDDNWDKLDDIKNVDDEEEDDEDDLTADTEFYLSRLDWVASECINRYNLLMFDYNKALSSSRAKVSNEKEANIKKINCLQSALLRAPPGNAKINKFVEISLAVERNIESDQYPKVTGSSSMMIMKNRCVNNNVVNDTQRVILECIISSKQKYRSIRGLMYKGNVVNSVLFPWEYDTMNFEYSEPDDIVYDEVEGKVLPFDITKMGFDLNKRRIAEFMTKERFVLFFNSILGIRYPRPDENPERDRMNMFVHSINRDELTKLSIHSKTLASIAGDERQLSSLLILMQESYIRLIKIAITFLNISVSMKEMHKRNVIRQLGAATYRIKQIILLIIVELLHIPEDNYDFNELFTTWDKFDSANKVYVAPHLRSK
jgi:hypothetical protein